MSRLKELMDLRGRRALVTGANGGLGKVMAETLAELGCGLLLLDRPGTDFNPLLAALRAVGKPEVACLECDLEDEGQRRATIEAVKADGLGLDILINNAAFVGTSGLQGWVAPFEEQSLATWRRALEVNLTAVFHLCQAFAPELRASAGGSIINIASIYGVLGPDWSLYDDTQMGNPAAYGASKGGVIQLTRWLATTMAPGVRVNAVSPGGISRQQPEVFAGRYCKRTPLGRMASEDDFRGVIAFLASDMSRYVTGQNLLVDGGWGTW
ncbi:MAG: short-chain dehydrogenase/reductase [Rhodocyclaceae bacterium]|nr:short-chain dehydrogenase/reductase [Rhodocyclaceae bacterium]